MPTQALAPPMESLMTAEELFMYSLPDKCVELIEGRLVVREPPGFLHGDVAARCLVAISIFVTQHRLGRVLAAETGFTLARKPDTVRAADVSFVSAAQLAAGPTAGYAEFAPELVVEVLSPCDRAGPVLAKVAAWITAGSRLVWIVDPSRRHVREYDRDGAVSLYSDRDELRGGDVLPGFVLAVNTLFD
jgi:Uma2 family endonuclease